jgi:serine/threonine protein kinase
VEDGETIRESTWQDVPSLAAATPQSDVPPQIAGFELVRLIGRGGMGVVWEAVEHRFERRVALKVHSSRSGSPTNTLWSEALVAARIDDPSIVRVLDVGQTLDGRPYYSMELVQGSDLAAVVADGPIPPRRAIALAADMARAAAAVHQHGVVHRDLKPRNVIVDVASHARVLDFGIALDARRGDDTLSPAIAGSPPYMAPEQILSDPIGPWTDIWAIGVILYEMLTGTRPFAARSIEALFSAIVGSVPGLPSTKQPSIHRDLDVIVGRCMAKLPAERFPSAGALFETLTAMTEGQRVEGLGPSAHAYTPKLPSPARWGRPRRDEAKKHIAWSWRLSASPEALWPFVSDTDRFNKAVGLPPVVFTDGQGAHGPERTGETRVLGMAVRWREYPFEWIRGREHSVFREYASGPVAALWNRVRLVPTAGGTELHHEVWISPRGLMGQVASFVEVERRLGPAIDRFYRHLDEVLARGASDDPFEPPHTPTEEQRQLVESGATGLRTDGFDAGLVGRLANHLLREPDSVVRVLRPYALAAEWGTDKGETLDAHLHAARVNLLEPVWEVICPTCQIAHETFRHLADVKHHGTCGGCATPFERDLCETVELVFAPHPSVRRIESATFCAGAPARRPHVVVQQEVGPGETRRVSVDLPRGAYQVMAEGYSWDVVASAVGFASVCEVSIAEARVEARPAVVQAGVVHFVLENGSDRERTVRVETAGPRHDAVSAAAALTHPSFRGFFSHQLLAHGERLSVRHLAFVFLRPLTPQGLFQRAGDGGACAELARLEEWAAAEARRHEGEMVPSSLGGLCMAFATSLRALEAALALRGRIAEAGASFSVPIGIGVHDGRCVALTRGGRPEFFGETLYRGEALAGDCPRHGIALSTSVTADRAVAVAAQASELAVVVGKTQSGPYAGRRVTFLVPPPS